MGVRGFIERLSGRSILVYVLGEDFGVRPGKVILENDRYMNRYREEEEQEQYLKSPYYLRFYISTFVSKQRCHKKLGRIRGRFFERNQTHCGVDFYNELVLIPQLKLEKMEKVEIEEKWIIPILKDRCKILNSLLYDPSLYPDANGDPRNYV